MCLVRVPLLALVPQQELHDVVAECPAQHVRALREVDRLHEILGKRSDPGDLPLVLHTIGLVRPDGTSRKADHDRVNIILNRVQDDILAEIARRFDPTVDDSNLPTSLDDAALFQTLAAWREKAWRNAELLAAAPTPGARELVVAEIEQDAAMEARAIVAATGYLPLLGGGAARDAFCAVHHDDP